MNKEDLFRPDVDEEKVPLLRGGIVRIRSLSRAEVLAIRRKEFATTDAYEQELLPMVMMDPVMTAEDVARWQRNSKPMEIEHVIDAVMAASGMGKGADKSNVQSVSSES